MLRAPRTLCEVQPPRLQHTGLLRLARALSRRQCLGSPGCEPPARDPVLILPRISWGVISQISKSLRGLRAVAKGLWRGMQRSPGPSPAAVPSHPRCRAVLPPEPAPGCTSSEAVAALQKHHLPLLCQHILGHSGGEIASEEGFWPPFSNRSHEVSRAHSFLHKDGVPQITRHS